MLRALCRSLTMMCCRNQAGLSPVEKGTQVRTEADWQDAGVATVLTQTFVVMPHSNLPHAAQAVRGSNLEDVQAVSMKSSVPI